MPPMVGIRTLILNDLSCHVSPAFEQMSLRCFLILMLLRPPIPTLFPYTTLFRSVRQARRVLEGARRGLEPENAAPSRTDRKSTRLNSSHVASSYAVFCLEKKQAVVGVEE